MINRIVLVAVSAIPAFVLGYFVGSGSTETPDGRSNNQVRPNEFVDESTVTEKTHAAAESRVVETVEVPAPSVAAVADANESEATPFESENRRRMVMRYNRTLADWFRYMGIDPEAARAIVERLADAEDRHREFSQTIFKAVSQRTPEDEEMRFTKAEMDSMRAERTRLVREVLGDYYESYVEYEKSIPIRQTVDRINENVEFPIGYSVREQLVSVFTEEYSGISSQIAIDRSVDRDVAIESMRDQAGEMRTRNRQVLDRAGNWLSTEQFDALAASLEEDARRIELMADMISMNR